MSGQAKIAIREWIEAAVDQRLQAQEFAGRLRHLRVLHQQKVAVHPEIGEMGADARLCLCDFVRVVNGNVIFAAAMDVE